MDESDDFTRLDDPAFLAERRRVREELGQAHEDHVKAELMDLFNRLNEEFLRRARVAWTAG